MPKHYKSNMIEHVKSIFTKITELDQTLSKHESTLKEQADLIKAQDKRVGDLEKIANSQLIWRIEDYSRKMKEAKAGNGDTLFSPTFTTSKHGYRLCASVCLNGDGKGKGTHMSVFISVLKGNKKNVLCILDIRLDLERFSVSISINLSVLEAKPKAILKEMKFICER